MIRALFAFFFRISLSGCYHPKIPTLFLVHQTSVLDMFLLSLAIPERLTLVIHAQNKPRLSTLLSLMRFAEVLVLDLNSPWAARQLAKTLSSGKPCALYTKDLALHSVHQLKTYQFLGLVWRRSKADIIPLRIEGMQNTLFTTKARRKGLNVIPKVNIHLLTAHSFSQDQYKATDKKRIHIHLFRLISDLSFAHQFQSRSLFSALIQGVRLGVSHNSTIEDQNRKPISYRQFLTRCFILGRQIKKQTAAKDYVGVMMPTTTAGMITFFALQAYRRIPAMLNFSMGFFNLISACTTANIKIIYTSEQFVATAKLETLITELRTAGIKVYFLEDFKPNINLAHKISGLIKALFPAWTYKNLGPEINPDEAALILFTSGSEGAPKGVALSHSNILANCHQMMSRVDFSSEDVFFNALPIFHCFGLTAGSIIPLMNGLSCFFYPSPLHYKVIPDLVHQVKASIMFGTDTFLTGYARAAEKNHFRSIRLVFAGAEKVKPETIRHWQEVFGVTIYEGYGATETSPVISLNCHMASEPGSVGILLPGLEGQIQAVEGISQGGRLLLRGPNIMLGYLCSETIGTIKAPHGGWHDTGDIVSINTEGFITIAGRAKRFAKIAGEMISLTAVECIAASLWPELLNAAVSKKCPKKGEQILLFSEDSSANKTSFIKKIQEQGYSDLLVPYQIFPGSKIPVLSSGKIDYVMLDKLLAHVIS